MGDNADQYVLISLRHLKGIYVNEKCFVELEKTEPKPAGKNLHWYLMVALPWWKMLKAAIKTTNTFPSHSVLPPFLGPALMLVFCMILTIRSGVFRRLFFIIPLFKLPVNYTDAA